MTNYLSKKAMLADLSISTWTARRLDKKITDEVNESHGAASDAGRYNKLLIAKEALRPVWLVANEARVLHMKMTQPWMDVGSRILSAALYFDYAEKMKRLEQEFDREVAIFCADYPNHVESRKAELNGLFREADYPAADLIHTKFGFEVKVLPCPDASDFRVDLAAEHADDIKRSIEKNVRAALDQAMQEPVRRVIETVGYMAERLRAYRPSSGKGDRSEGVFRDSLVDNVRDLVTLLPAFNLTDDPTLTAIAQRMERELCVESADALRENPLARESVAASAEAILAQAKQFMA